MSVVGAGSEIQTAAAVYGGLAMGSWFLLFGWKFVVCGIVNVLYRFVVDKKGQLLSW
jgi:hypothetical protein